MGAKTVATKAMKLGTYMYVKLDEALYIWFRLQQEKNLPICGRLVQEKA